MSLTLWDFNKIRILKGEVNKLIIHTEQAAKIVEGRAGDSLSDIQSLQYGQAGLFSFSKSARLLDKRINEEDPDPYALYCISLINDEIEQCDKRYHKIRDELNNKLKQLPVSADIDFVPNNDVKKYKVKFSSDLAYNMSKLISDYDEIVQLAMTCKKFNLISSNEYKGKYTYNLGKPIRKILKLPKTIPDSKLIGLNEFVNNNSLRKDLENQFFVIPDDFNFNKFKVDEQSITT